MKTVWVMLGGRDTMHKRQQSGFQARRGGDSAELASQTPGGCYRTKDANDNKHI